MHLLHLHTGATYLLLQNRYAVKPFIATCGENLLSDQLLCIETFIDPDHLLALWVEESFLQSIRLRYGLTKTHLTPTLFLNMIHLRCNSVFWDCVNWGNSSDNYSNVLCTPFV